MRRTGVQIVLLAGSTVGGAAIGQQPEAGPVIVGEQREQWGGLELRRLEISAEVLAQYRSDRLRQAGAPDLADREKLLRTVLDLGGDVSVGHQNFLDISGAAQLGVDHRRFDSDTVALESSERSIVDLFDVRGLLLGTGPMPVTLYTRREENILDRPFAGSINQLVTESGVIAQLNADRAPTTFHYYHREQNLDDPFDLFASRTIQDTFTAQSGIRIDDDQRLDIAYTFDHVDEAPTPATSDTYDRHDANIVHTLNFGDDPLRHELRSSLRYYEQGSLFPQRDVRLDELLVLHHTDRLESRYTLTLDEQSRSGRDQRLYRGEAAIRHRLFDSLVSRASIGTQRLDADDFTSEDAFLSADFDYTKLAGPGRIDASAGASFNTQDNSALGGSLSIVNEAHVFNDPFPIVLPRRNIVPGSIVLTPTVGFPVFVEGVDYTLAILPDRAEVTPIPGGAILDGQTILASYDVGPEPASEIDTSNLAFSFRYTLTRGPLRGLGGYTRYRTTDHSLRTATPASFVLDEPSDLLFGVELVRSDFDLRLEHERHESDVNPFNTLRAQGRYYRPIGRDSSLSLDLTHEEIDFTARGNRVDFDRATARWLQRIDHDLDLSARLEYRNERDSLAGDSEAFDQSLAIAWRKGRTLIYASIRNGFLYGPSSDRDSQLFSIGIRRSF